MSRPILPFRQPPATSSPLPALPPRPAQFQPPFPSAPSWAVSTHIFPAAYPRARVGAAVAVSKTQHQAKPPRAGRMSKDELERKTAALFERQAKAELVEDGAESAEAEVGLWIAVNRYYRAGGQPATQGAVTIVACHATGLHKETWEPTLEALVASSPAGQLVEEIWALDSVHQGDSAILNEGRVGNTSDWIDFGRDVANFVAHYLPPPSSSSPPYLLPFLPLSPSLFNLSQSILPLSPPILHRSRKIVGLGHSLGAAAVSFASSIVPTVFHALLMVDVVMFGPLVKDTDDYIPIVAIARGALSRKDYWKGGREEAKKEFQGKKAFFGRWSKDVLERFVEFALKDVKEEKGPVELRCPKDWEGMVFADPSRRGSHDTFLRLAYLPSHLSIHWIFAEQNPILNLTGQDELIEITKHCRKVTKQYAKGASHLIVQEKPKDLGRILGKALEEDFGEMRSKL